MNSNQLKNPLQKTAILLMVSLMMSFYNPGSEADAILSKVEQNLSSRNRVFEATMTIHGKRSSRTLTSRTYSEGDKKSFTEYLSPAADQGTKMLKLENQLWIFTPSTDRIVQISGHMLRQSVMGSDLSYEDMMDDRKLSELYDVSVAGEEILEGRQTKKLVMIAKKSDVAYYKRQMWVDIDRYVPLKEELYARSGQLLKQTSFSEVEKIQGRWFPKKIVFKDMLKQGKGTEFVFTKIQFDQNIPEYIFSKSSLRK